MPNNYVYLSPGNRTKLEALHSFTKNVEDTYVTDICRSCGISRTTFYSHFETKYSIGLWFLDFAFDLFFKDADDFSWNIAMASFFSFLYSEKDSLKYAFSKTPMRGAIESQFLDHAESARQLAIQKGVEPDEELSFYVKQAFNIGNLLTVHWCQDCMTIEPSRMAYYVTSFMPEALITVFDPTFSGAELLEEFNTYTWILK